ncbi:MAG: glycerol-3-phosphate 1-O-acyltransferase PlsY [Xanthobacteraceae bacterium]|jgi:glycerol-3-phosphate acyltransferase PlsY
MSTAIALILGYLLGSIPFGLIVTRLAGTGDIRAVGSGNIGATNVLRTGHKGLAAATLLGDMLKGTTAVLIAAFLWGREASLTAALGAVLGHIFPVWLGFKGGKGVATYIGVLLGIAWPGVVAFAAVWALVAAALRYSSLAGLVASALTPAFLLWWTHDVAVALVFLALTILLWIMHRANIARLIDGTETKIGQKSQAAR